MKEITIGDKSLMQISKEDILQLAVMQGCCAHLDFWNYPTYWNMTIPCFLIQSLYRINLQEKRMELKAFRWFSSFVLATYLIIIIEKT